jgi:hypothetical protein
VTNLIPLALDRVLEIDAAREANGPVHTLCEDELEEGLQEAGLVRELV